MFCYECPIDECTRIFKTRVQQLNHLKSHEEKIK
jgi:hypothetical protein